MTEEINRKLSTEEFLKIVKSNQDYKNFTAYNFLLWLIFIIPFDIFVLSPSFTFFNDFLPSSIEESLYLTILLIPFLYFNYQEKRNITKEEYLKNNKIIKTVESQITKI